MKKDRQRKILELISVYPINTQEELTEKLCEAGYPSTQATVSRDIRDLHIIKSLTKEGYRYISAESTELSSFDDAIFSSVKKVSSAGNIVVVKTSPGLANAVAVAIDSMNIPQILGCVAGDDTIMVVTDDELSAQEVAIKMRG